MSQTIFIWCIVLTGISVGAWVIEGWSVLKALLRLQKAGRHLKAGGYKFNKVQSIAIVTGIVLYFTVHPVIGGLVIGLGMLAIVRSLINYVVEAVGCMFNLLSTVLSDGIPLIIDLTLTFLLVGALGLSTGATGAMLGLLASDIFSTIIVISKLTKGGQAKLA